MLKQLTHVNQWVHDQDEALAFYTEKIGLVTHADVSFPEMGDFRWLAVSPAGQPDVSIVLMAIPGAPVFEPDTAEQDHCGSCQACLDICPTNAFPAPYRLDARRCISYLTIESKGPIPLEFRAAIGNRIYGCDDCLAVCPWNKFAKTASEAKLAARDDLRAPALADLLELDDLVSFGGKA